MQAKNAPRYQQIAADIAAKIAGGEYKIGDKIFARSSLASQYHVSSETARRAICVLCDMKIVESIQGVGVVIQSPENAVTYVRQFDEEYTISAMKEGLIEALTEQNQRNNEINFWHNTLATVIAIRHQEELALSPGPYARLHVGDIIYFIGQEDCIIRVEQFFNGNR